MDHDRRWRVAERYHVLFLRTSFLDLVLVCGGRLSADFESHFSQNIFVAYSRNPVKPVQLEQVLIKHVLLKQSSLLAQILLEQVPLLEQYALLKQE